LLRAVMVGAVVRSQQRPTSIMRCVQPLRPSLGLPLPSLGSTRTVSNLLSLTVRSAWPRLTSPRRNPRLSCLPSADHLGLSHSPSWAGGAPQVTRMNGGLLRVSMRRLHEEDTPGVACLRRSLLATTPHTACSLSP
jgi:hypothetical protein